MADFVTLPGLAVLATCRMRREEMDGREGGRREEKKKGHLLEEIKPTREEEWETDDVKWCKGEKKHGDGEGKR